MLPSFESSHPSLKKELKNFLKNPVQQEKFNLLNSFASPVVNSAKNSGASQENVKFNTLFVTGFTDGKGTLVDMW